MIHQTVQINIYAPTQASMYGVLLASLSNLAGCCRANGRLVALQTQSGRRSCADGFKGILSSRTYIRATECGISCTVHQDGELMIDFR